MWRDAWRESKPRLSQIIACGMYVGDVTPGCTVSMIYQKCRSAATLAEVFDTPIKIQTIDSEGLQVCRVNFRFVVPFCVEFIKCLANALAVAAQSSEFCA